MKTTIQWCGAFAAAVVAASCNNVDQPAPDCLSGHGGFAAKYTLRPDQTVSGPCAEKKGEILGVQLYTPAAGVRTLAIRPDTLAAFENADAAHPTISTGDLAGLKPDENNFCSAPQLSTAEQHVPADPGAGTDAADIVYSWENVNVFATPEIPGTQLEATLHFTEGGCTADYDVTAVFPAVSCAAEDGTTPDESLCALPDVNTGLALNPDFAVTCDPETLLCVLAGPVPSLNR